MKIVRWNGEVAFSPEKMRKSNLFETPRFFLDVYAFEPGQEQKPHDHAGSDKVYLVVEGHGVIQVGKESADVSPGDAVLAPSGVVHGAKNPGPGRLVLLAFMAPHPDHA
jgi:mannose-6-phosphate isomerase-like protein (cupin superfamily)